MATPPRSPPNSDNPPEVTSKRTRQSTKLRYLTTRSLYHPRPIVNVNPTTSRGSGPHKDKFLSYLGVVVREKNSNCPLQLECCPRRSKDNNLGRHFGKFF